MASPVKLYQREMHDNLGFFANWLPGDSIEVGEVGRLEQGRFRRTTSLQELGIPFQTTQSAGAQDLQYTSSKGTRLASQTGAGMAGAAEATLAVEFSRAGAFLFHAAKLRMVRLDNRPAIAQALLAAYEQGRWTKDSVLVEAVHVAAHATILVSQDNTSEIVLGASVPGLLAISLADPSLELRVTSTRGRVVHIIAAQAPSPLYSCLRVKDPLLGPAAVRPVRGRATERTAAALSRPPIDDLLDS